MRRYFYKLASMLLLISMGTTLQSQAQFGNEWVDHSLTYYKFKIAQNGVYRIPQSALAAAGLGSVSGAQVTIYRHGVKIPVYVSTSGTMGSADYIEFFAEKGDGAIDVDLYNNPNIHPTQLYNLITDTATYYLAVSSGTHPRYSNGSFTLPGTLPTPEAYMMTEAIANNGNRPNVFSIGRSYSSDHAVQKSTYDNAESYQLNTINSSTRLSNNNIALTKLYTATSVPSFVDIAYTNSRSAVGNLQFSVNSTVLKDTALIGFGTIKRRFPVSSSAFSSTTNVKARDLTSISGFNAIVIEYPRQFSYSGLSNSFTQFYINAGVGNKYLLFQDLSSMTETYLYNLSSNTRYTGVPSGTSDAQFYIPAPTTRSQYAFVNAADIQTIGSLVPIQFTDYSLSSNQGNYIILTHKNYIEDASDPIGNYAAYRSSAAGGSWKVQVVDVTELYDQFGWGYDFHPLSVKRFLHYAYTNWSEQPTHLFIIGKGLLYNLYRTYQNNPSAYEYGNLVPTYGNPGSDNLFSDFDNDNIPELATGRLSVWSTAAIHNYLEKVIAYENELKPAAVPDLENTFWKKNALMIAGSTELDQASFILPAYNTSSAIYQDTLIGGHVTVIKKNTTGIVPEETDDHIIKSRLQQGMNRLVFYGHAFSSGFDYNLNDPDEFVSFPRFPNFIAMGCNVSQVFETAYTISEEYIDSEMGGSISLIASNTLGYPTHLTPYLTNYFRTLSSSAFEKTVGEHYRQNIASIPGSASNPLFVIHLQNIILQGDPGLAVFAPEYPDYYTDNNLIQSSVNPLTTGTDSATISTVIYNLGRASNDTVAITLEHTKPNGSIVYHTDTLRRVIKNIDTVHFNVKFNNMEDLGLNKISVRVNPGADPTEISMAQNTAILNLFMSADIVVPVFPYEFSIVHNTPLTLRASTLSMFDEGASYMLEIDTTEKFNSPLKKQTTINSDLGGLLTWQPPITMVDSQVYYWRAAVGNTATDSTIWTNSSFVYLKDGHDGWNQSHFFQFKKNEPFLNLDLEDTARDFKFGLLPNKVIVFNRVFSDANQIHADVRTLLNNAEVDKLGCSLDGTIKFILIDPETALPVPNTGAQYGSIAPCISGGRNIRQFEYSLKTAASRKRAANFIDSIPDGHYVIVTNYIYDVGGYWTGTTVGDWAGDVALHGETGNLRYKLKQLGFDQIDSFNRKRVFTFVTKKNDASFENITAFTSEPEELITVNFDILTRVRHGNMQSVTVGPTQKWQALHWDINHPLGNAANDSDYVEVYGVAPGVPDSLLIRSSARAISLLDINPNSYPYLKLKWHTRDSIDATSSNLKFWRVIHDPLPEGALNPERHYTKAADTIFEGQKLHYEIAFDNVSNVHFADSLLVHYTINKADGTSELLQTQKIKKLNAFDTAVASITFDPRHYPGHNTLMVDVNPESMVPEQYHPNNFTFFNFYQKSDSTNPVLDVTFDGVHILDRDIVSAKPFIKIMIKDENLNMPMADTNVLRVQLLRPGSTTPEEVPIDGVIASFNPSTGTDKNEASIDYKPTLNKDGLYKLIVSGRDEAGNTAGSNASYEIQFTVENKPSITNLLNYPNPFSTSTAFVFTLTGSEVPQQFKIQIMTVTGKIVKEITRQELGPIHIGRNITEYKWDGRDQYGQLLGNGVYIYRLVTELNGNKVEHRANEAIDQFFNKSGYGKMYIMR